MSLVCAYSSRYLDYLTEERVYLDWRLTFKSCRHGCFYVQYARACEENNNSVYVLIGKQIYKLVS